ncbi:hypothetical protein A4R27_21625 [Priestia endophytica]|nr:hypothetical protein A4R27_21625 [Priestia endophytica]
MREFLSSFLLITSWLIFAISGYLLFWTILAPYYMFIPFAIILSIGLLCRYLSKKLVSNSKTT